MQKQIVHLEETLTLAGMQAAVQAGTPLNLTSHPGNASRYKHTLWGVGCPEFMWDVTCCKADTNNRAMKHLEGGVERLLVDECFYDRVQTTTTPNHRFVVAYAKTTEGVRLARHHVKVCERQFPSVISSVSRLLLSQEQRVRDMCEYLAATMPAEIFPRFVDADGVLRPICESGISPADMAASFIGLLRELDHLLFSDESIEVKGGACYGGAILHVSAFLVRYWNTGCVEQVDVSGPDMVRYSTHEGFSIAFWNMLEHLVRWNPSLVPHPKHATIRMVDGTTATVSHVPGHESESVMERKAAALSGASNLSMLRRAARDDNRLWPTRVRQGRTYFSQHDLARVDGRVAVHPTFMDTPLGPAMQRALQQADQALGLS